MKIHVMFAYVLAVAIPLSGIGMSESEESIPKTNEISITMLQDVLVEDYETNAFTRWIEENCDVDLSFDLLPAGDEGADKLSIILTSGQELSDVINVNMPVIDDYIYGSNGLFMDLTEMFKSSVYISKRLKQYPQLEIMKYVTAPDGKIYSVPAYFHETIGDAPRRCWANTDLLEAVGKEIPTTTDDLYDVLVAIRDNDPNGNGKADEIPLIAGNLEYLVGYLMNAFVYCNPNNQYYTVSDGEIGVCYNTVGFREGLRYMAKLCRERLLTPLIFTQTSDQFKQIVNSDGKAPVAGFSITFATSTMLTNYSENPFTPMYIAIPPLKGPTGVKLTEYAPAYPACQWHITSNCKNPEAAFRVADFTWSEEGYPRARFGVKGEQWDIAEPGQPSYFEGQEARYTYVSVWNDSQNVHWRLNVPCFSYDDNDLRVWDENPINATYTCALSCADYAACLPGPGEYVGRLVMTAEEVDNINEIQSTLLTYVNESIARFVTGDLDIEKDWDAFLDELEAIGLKSFLEVSQKAYDRMNR